MWSIHDVGVVAVQLVRMDRSGYAVVSVRLGLSHPILFAQSAVGLGERPLCLCWSSWS